MNSRYQEAELTGLPLVFWSNILPSVSLPIYLMETVCPFLAWMPVPIFPSLTLIPPSRIFTPPTSFAFWSSSASLFNFSFFSFLVFFSSPDPVAMALPPSALSFLLSFFCALFERGSVSIASDSRGRFKDADEAGGALSSISSNRLKERTIHQKGKQEELTMHSYSASSLSLSSSSGLTSTSELTSRRSYASSSKSSSESLL